MTDNKKNILIKGGIILLVAFLLDNFVLSFVVANLFSNASLNLWITVADICSSLDILMPFIAIGAVCSALYGSADKSFTVLRVFGINLIAFVTLYLIQSLFEINRAMVFVRVTALALVSLAAVFLSFITCNKMPKFKVKPIIVSIVLMLLFAAAYIWQGNAEITAFEQSTSVFFSYSGTPTLNPPPYYVSALYYLSILFAYLGLEVISD